MHRGIGPTLGALLLAAALPVHAATPKRVCHLIPDDRGDTGTAADVVPGTAGDDLLSADLASDGRTITAVLRLDALPPTDPAAPLGRRYAVQFRPKGLARPLYVEAVTGPLGTSFSYGYVEVDAARQDNTYPLGVASGRLDAARREVHVSAPTRGFAKRASLRVGTHLLDPTAAVSRVVAPGLVPNTSVAGVTVPLGGSALSFDVAQGRTYVVGTPSCVRVGS